MTGFGGNGTLAVLTIDVLPTRDSVLRSSTESWLVQSADLQQLAGLGVHRRIPQVSGGRIVDGHLPGEAQSVLRRLPAEASRDRGMRDAAVRHERLPVVLLEDPEVDGLGEIEPGGGGVDGICGVESGDGGPGGAETALERAGGEDDPPVGRDVDGRMARRRPRGPGTAGSG